MENDELIRRAEDLCRRCEKTASVTHTAFLTPAEQFALEAWAKSAPDCKMLLCGGNEGCERRAAFFLPFYMEEDGFDASEYISVLRAKAHFGQPSHRDYMGAVMGLGIKREWLGDIWVSGEDAVIFLMQSVERHVADGLDKVGRCGVKVCTMPLGELKAPERRVKRVSFSVKSMRFDAVLAGIFGLSRTAASSHIAEGRRASTTLCASKTTRSYRPATLYRYAATARRRSPASGGVSRKGRLFVEAEIYK